MNRTGFKVLLAFTLVMAGWLCLAQQAPTIRIPSPPMNIGVVSGVPGLMPEGFRGTEKGIENFEEDCEPPRNSKGMVENSELYQKTTTGLGAEAKNAKYSGPPNITWTVKRQNDDGTESILQIANTNKAFFQTSFPTPGTYALENDGARGTEEAGGSTTGITGGSDGASGKDLLVNTPGSGGSEGAGSQQTTPPGAGGSQASSGNQSTPGGEGSDKASGSTTNPGGGRQVVTSTNVMKVKAHDITSPNLFALFQEGAGAINLAESEAALADNFDKQLSELKGKIAPDTEFKGDLKESSLLAIVESPTDAPAERKTSAIVKKGALFDQGGRKLSEEGDKVSMTLSNALTRTRRASVDAVSAPNSAVYVRRNVPFLVIARQSDNGGADPTAVTYSIQEKGGKTVEKVEGAFLFRVPNFPREKYSDQPEYEFVMTGSDKVGNETVVRLPLHVVDTQTSFEAGKAE